MKNTIWQRRLMLGCVVILCVFLVTIVGRLLTSKILIKKLSMHNIVTQTVFFDRPSFWVKTEPLTDKGIKWAQLYPFKSIDIIQAEETKENKQDVKKTFFVKYLAKTGNIEKKIKEWCTENLVCYNYLVDSGYSYKKSIKWTLVPDKKVHIYTMADGHLTDLKPAMDMSEKAQSVYSFSEFAKARDIGFFYVQAPSVVNKYADEELNGKDFKNANADALVAKLREYQVDVLDLRDVVHEDFADADYHNLFFYTDHHWKPSTGLWAAGVLARKLHDDYAINVDFSHFSKDAYDEVLYPKYFLGSWGRQVTLANTDPDDFWLYYPRFETKIRWRVPNFGIDEFGDFTNMYDMRCMNYLGYGAVSLSAYATYAYSDKPVIYGDNLMLADFPEQTVMVIRDRFTNSTLPFLLMGVKHVVEVDIRHFTGSLEALVDEVKPDVIYIMYYTGSIDGKINWQSHKDLFDFR